MVDDNPVISNLYQGFINVLVSGVLCSLKNWGLQKFYVGYINTLHTIKSKPLVIKIIIHWFYHKIIQLHVKINNILKIKTIFHNKNIVRRVAVYFIEISLKSGSSASTCNLLQYAIFIKVLETMWPHSDT